MDVGLWTLQWKILPSLSTCRNSVKPVTSLFSCDLGVIGCQLKIPQFLSDVQSARWSKVRHHTIRWAGKTQQGGFHLDKNRSSQHLVFRVKHPELQAHWSSLSLYLKYPEPAIFEKDESHYIRVFQHQSLMTCARRLPGLYYMMLQLKTGGRLQ